MNCKTLTIEDCIRKLEQEGVAVIIEDGAVTGFVKESLYQRRHSDTGR